MTANTISASFPFESKYVEIHGSKMHYIDEGSGDPILFLTDRRFRCRHGSFKAKNRLSEVVDKAIDQGPQVITRRGVETAVVLSFDDYRRLRKPEGPIWSTSFRPRRSSGWISILNGSLTSAERSTCELPARYLDTCRMAST